MYFTFLLHYAKIPKLFAAMVPLGLEAGADIVVDQPVGGEYVAVQNYSIVCYLPHHYTAT